jgi:hypothetical protein
VAGVEVTCSGFLSFLLAFSCGNANDELTKQNTRGAANRIADFMDIPFGNGEGSAEPSMFAKP